MLRRLVVPFTAAITLVTSIITPAPASAATAPCTSVAGSPTCRVWTGKVAWVADGDTLMVDVYGDGTGTPKPIRMIGVQAMEQSVYSPNPARRRGACHALAATARVEQLVKAGGRMVRLKAQRASSSSRGRPLRSMSVKINGTWRDIGLDLIRGGHGLWLSFPGEWAWNSSYRLAQARAAQSRRNLFDTDYCGAGPYQSSALSVWVNADADGDDNVNLNGEWIRVGNGSSYPVPIGGWWVRPAGPRQFTFPAGTVVPARGAVFVHIGRGAASATHKYWGLSSPIFENSTRNAQALGDSAFLFDRQGDVRAWMQYPCVLNCASPLAGKVKLTVRYRLPEEVEVANSGSAPINLFGHVLFSYPYLYHFTSSTVLRPGQELRLRTSIGTSSGLLRYWGKPSTILNDAGDAVSLRPAAEATVTCVSWGSGRC